MLLEGTGRGGLIGNRWGRDGEELSDEEERGRKGHDLGGWALFY